MIILSLSFLSAGSCSATVNKSTASVVVSTADQDNWYDLGDKTLSQTFAECNGVKSTDKNIYAFTYGCDNNSKHDDYLYTDTPDERKIYPVDKNFTVKASASASSGSMTKIKLEWIYGWDDMPKDSSWTDAANHPNSATCDNKGSCTFCVVGGKCDKPVIPQEALSVKENGDQNRFHFRVSFSSSTGDTVTSGVDGTLSKFHSLVVCGPKCHGCEKYTPKVILASSQAPSDWCSGLDDIDSYYVVNWQNANMPSSTQQTAYKLSVRKIGTTSPVQTKEVNSSEASAQVPSAWLKYATEYEWQVAVRYEGQGCSWTVTSPWSTDATNIKVSERYPIPYMRVTNQAGVDCLSAVGACKESDTLSFNASGSSSFDLPPESDSSEGSYSESVSYSEECSASSTVYSSGEDGEYSSESSSSYSLSFNWTVDKTSRSGATFSQNFSYEKSSSSSSTGKSADGHSIELTASDCLGRSCTIKVPLKLDSEPEPKPEPDPSCSTGPTQVEAALGKPKDFCMDLSDSNYYALSWSTKDIGSARQTGYEIIVHDKGGAKSDQKITHQDDEEGKATIVKIPKEMIAYGGSYQISVKPTLRSADNKCSWTPSGNIVLMDVPQKYPRPQFTVKDAATDCKPGEGNALCEAGKKLRFEGTASADAGIKSYDWTIQKDAINDKFNTATFDKDYGQSGTYKVSFGVTDKADHYCAISKDLLLKEPPCLDKPAVVLKAAAITGDLCQDPKPGYRLDWENPSGYTQTDYEIQVFENGNPAFKIDGKGKGEQYCQIGSSLLSWDKKYSWQVKTTLTKGSCTYPAPSPISSGSLNITLPYQPPHPVIRVTSGTNDCLSGQCKEGDTFRFYGGDSQVFEPVNGLQYNWTIDGKNRTGAEISEAFPGKSHEVTLSVTEDGQTCTSDKMQFGSDKAATPNNRPSWNEIAPQYD